MRLVGLMWPAGPACMSSCQLGRDVVRRIAINLVRWASYNWLNGIPATQRSADQLPQVRGGCKESGQGVLYCMFYQLLGVQLSCSSTQSWGSVLPSIVGMGDPNSRSCPLLFSNRNLGSFYAKETEILYTHSLWRVVDHSKSKMHFRDGSEGKRWKKILMMILELE